MSEAQPPIPQPPPGLPPSKPAGAGVCCCARCRCHGLTGPVLLIVVGVIFLLPQLLRSLDIQVSIWDLWPLFLIAIGVLKLLESTASIEGHRG